MKIAAAQLDVRLGDIEFNQSRIIELVGNATAAGAGLVLAFLLGGYSLEGTAILASRTLEPQHIQRVFRDLG